MTTQATLPADATSSRRAWLSEVTSVVRDEVLTGWSPDSCIASTRVLLETLKAFGVEGRATPTRVAVFNPTAWKLAREQVPVTAWSDGAWSVGVEGDGEALDGRWNGHLVAVLPRFVPGRVLIDPSGDQFSRPERSIAATALIATLPPLWTPVDPLVVEPEEVDGPTYVYAPLVKSPGWRDAPDWCGNTVQIEQAVAASVGRLQSLAAERLDQAEESA